ncbi:cysteine proteinase [Massarina eburnea CBS 473.64]|uniref:Cysteine proteinase n=1 Tax=Massarina eburnea CBS 473.64 TaxID=1395130 RepID=A0A6A6RJT9_9PLEO|nr:cysteine proteinase [Massarina eburnea CBS 473.64]
MKRHDPQDVHSHPGSALQFSVRTSLSNPNIPTRQDTRHTLLPPIAMADDAPETLEALQSRHRKEQRDLISRTTQKKKQATKKTRKGVNDECERLEHELKERQARETDAHSGEAAGQEEEVHDDEESGEGNAGQNSEGVEDAVGSLTVSPSKDTDRSQADGEGSSSGGKKKVNRAKARLARRAAEQSAIAAQAAEEAANMPDLREQERARMDTQLSRHNLKLHEIRADGHCLYAAVADQMQTRDLDLTPRVSVKVIENGSAEPQDYKKARYAAAAWIEAHADDFTGFMEEPLPEYLAKIRETGEWGGHMELMALAKTYGVVINVLHGDGRVDKIAPGEEEGQTQSEIWLGYYRHSHGLGEHYNSLRKIP